MAPNRANYIKGKSYQRAQKGNKKFLDRYMLNSLNSSPTQKSYDWRSQGGQGACTNHSTEKHIKGYRRKRGRKIFCSIRLLDWVLVPVRNLTIGVAKGPGDALQFPPLKIRLTGNSTKMGQKKLFGFELPCAILDNRSIKYVS